MSLNRALSSPRYDTKRTVSCCRTPRQGGNPGRRLQRRSSVAPETARPEASGSTYPEGKTATARVGKSGFFITPISVTQPIFTRLLPNSICRWSSDFVQLDANGHQLAQTTVTFGPRVCFSQPKPEITTGGGVKTFTIRLGANGYIPAAQPGDKIACRAAGHTLTITVPQASAGHTEHTPISEDRQLTLSVSHDHKDRIWVSCR